MSSKDKANRTIREYIKPYLEQHSYVAKKVERTHKWAKEKDVYSEGDLIAVPIEQRDRPVLLIQAKTNTPANREDMRRCAEAFAGPSLAVLCITHVRNNGAAWGTGLRIQRYHQDSTLDEVDLRVKTTLSPSGREQKEQLEQEHGPHCKTALAETTKL